MKVKAWPFVSSNSSKIPHINKNNKTISNTVVFKKNWGCMKITGAYHNQHSVKVHYLQDDAWLKLLFPRLAWEKESGRKTPAKEPKHLNSNTDTCRNTAHTVWLRAFSSFPFNFSFALFSGLDSYGFVEFPWRTSIFCISYLSSISSFPVCLL